MKVSIRKDGFVYVQDKQLSPEKLLTLFEELAKKATQEKELKGTGAESVHAGVGSHFYKFPKPLNYYRSIAFAGFKTVEQWQGLIKGEVDSIRRWYEALPVDEQEVTF